MQLLLCHPGRWKTRNIECRWGLYEQQLVLTLRGIELDELFFQVTQTKALTLILSVLCVLELW
jgi:hypothetical protein